MAYNIFYSWHNDLNPNHQRHFIWAALKDAKKALEKEWSITGEVEIENREQNDITLNLNRGGTEGFPGTKNIADAIREKIDQADIFIADVTVINAAEIGGRATSNPNVLFELGYAVARHGWERVVLVANRAYGNPEILPFDIRAMGINTYYLPEEKNPELKQIQKNFTGVLKNVLKDLISKLPEDTDEKVKSVPKVEVAIQALQASLPDQTAFVRDYMSSLFEQLLEIAPDLTKDVPEPDEILLQALEQSKSFLLDFTRLSATVARLRNLEASEVIVEGFTPILERYAPGFNGPQNYYEYSFDFFRFIGHEFFVSFISCLIGEKQWHILAEVLKSRFYIHNIYVGRGEFRLFTELSASTPLLDKYRNDWRKLSRISVRSDILKERHSAGELGELMPIKRFGEADYFLYLRSMLSDKYEDTWIPYGSLNLREAPKFLIDAASIKVANQLIEGLGIDNIDVLKSKLASKELNLEKIFYGQYTDRMRFFDQNSLASY